MMNYKTGGKKIANTRARQKLLTLNQKKVLEVQNKIAKGDTNPVKGTGAARKQKDVTWY